LYFTHPVIQRGLRLQHRHKHPRVVEQLPAQRLMEALDLPGRGRRARLREPVRDPVAAADLVEQHLATAAAATEARGELLAVIGEDLLRRPIALKRFAEGQKDRAPGRALDHPREHAEPRVIIDAGDDPALAQLARSDIDQPRPIDDVDLPQLHRRRPLPPHIVRRFAAPRPADHEPVPDQDAMHRRARGHRLRQRRAAHQLMHDPQRAPLRVHAAQLTHARLHLRQGLARAQSRPRRAVRQPR
jgi:hypothetical protein